MLARRVTGWVGGLRLWRFLARRTKEGRRLRRVRNALITNFDGLASSLAPAKIRVKQFSKAFS